MTDSKRNQNWFHIKYATSASAGLPPIVQAEQIVRYRDETGTWLVALWASTANGDSVYTCILRVPATQVAHATRHHNMADAATSYIQ